MNCGICNKPMRKDIQIDEVRTCYHCRMVWIKGFMKMREFAIKHKEELLKY